MLREDFTLSLKLTKMNYKQKALKHWGFGEQDFVPCMICGSESSDLHHIKLRSQQGKDDITNLIFLCRHHHNQAHFKTEPYLHEEELQEILNFHLGIKVVKNGK